MRRAGDRLPATRGWVEHPFLHECWRHDSYPGLIAARHTAGTLLVAHLAQRTPKLARVEQLAQLAMGPGVVPFSTVIFPLALRLPLDGPGLLQLPLGGMRCRRVWPAVTQPAYVERVEGVDVEFRVTASSTSAGVRLYAEAFIGGPHQRAKQLNDEPDTPLARALLFDADARQVLTRNTNPGAGVSPRG